MDSFTHQDLSSLSNSIHQQNPLLHLSTRLHYSSPNTFVISEETTKRMEDKSHQDLCSLTNQTLQTKFILHQNSRLHYSSPNTFVISENSNRMEVESLMAPPSSIIGQQFFGSISNIPDEFTQRPNLSFGENLVNTSVASSRVHNDSREAIEVDSDTSIGNQTNEVLEIESDISISSPPRSNGNKVIPVESDISFRSPPISNTNGVIEVESDILINSPPRLNTNGVIQAESDTSKKSLPKPNGNEVIPVVSDISTGSPPRLKGNEVIMAAEVVSDDPLSNSTRSKIDEQNVHSVNSIEIDDLMNDLLKDVEDLETSRSSLEKEKDMSVGKGNMTEGPVQEEKPLFKLTFRKDIFLNGKSDVQSENIANNSSICRLQNKDPKPSITELEILDNLLVEAGMQQNKDQEMLDNLLVEAGMQQTSQIKEESLSDKPHQSGKILGNVNVPGSSNMHPSSYQRILSKPTGFDNPMINVGSSHIPTYPFNSMAVQNLKQNQYPASFSGVGGFPQSTSYGSSDRYGSYVPQHNWLSSMRNDILMRQERQSFQQSSLNSINNTQPIFVEENKKRQSFQQSSLNSINNTQPIFVEENKKRKSFHQSSVNSINNTQLFVVEENKKQASPCKARYSKHEGKEPLRTDPKLPPGWTRRISQRATGATRERYDVYVTSSEGKKYRSKLEIMRHFELIGETRWKWQDFDFNPFGSSNLPDMSKMIVENEPISEQQLKPIVNYNIVMQPNLPYYY